MKPSLILLVSSAFLAEVSSKSSLQRYFPCLPCSGENCNTDLSKCMYGTKTVCNKPICASGPGEPCGGYMDNYGKCADTYTCNHYCNRCTGCDLFGNCYLVDDVSCNRLTS